jgi:hypothetical protein
MAKRGQRGWLWRARTEARPQVNQGDISKELILLQNPLFCPREFR